MVSDTGGRAVGVTGTPLLSGSRSLVYIHSQTIKSGYCAARYKCSCFTLFIFKMPTSKFQYIYLRGHPHF